MIFRYFHIILFLLVLSCDDELVFDNPLDDENNPDFVEPDTFITNENLNNSIISNDFIIIFFEGNELAVEYAYNFNGEVWSDWSSNTSAYFNYLNEGNYTFEVKSRYITGIEDSTPAEILFEVDAVAGPGLRIYPLNKTINAGSNNMVSLYLEEVSNVSFGSITINLVSNNCNSINITSIEEGDLFTDESAVFIYENEGNINTLNFGLTGENGLSGTGEIAKIHLNNDGSGCNNEIQLIIDIENSELRDYDNNEINIIDSSDGVINE